MVTEGAEVSAGQGVIVEAMKMENELGDHKWSGKATSCLRGRPR